MPTVAFYFSLRDLTNIYVIRGRRKVPEKIRTHIHTCTRVVKHQVPMSLGGLSGITFPLFVRLISVLSWGCTGGSHFSLDFYFLVFTRLLFARGGATGFRSMITFISTPAVTAHPRPMMLAGQGNAEGAGIYWHSVNYLDGLLLNEEGRLPGSHLQATFLSHYVSGSHLPLFVVCSPGFSQENAIPQDYGSWIWIAAFWTAGSCLSPPPDPRAQLWNITEYSDLLHNNKAQLPILCWISSCKTKSPAFPTLALPAK